MSTSIHSLAVSPPVDAVQQAEVLGVLLGVLVALVTLIVVIVKTYGQAKQANQAVNNTGPGEHRLYDKILHISEDIAHLKERADQNDDDHRRIFRKLEG